MAAIDEVYRRNHRDQKLLAAGITAIALLLGIAPREERALFITPGDAGKAFGAIVPPAGFGTMIPAVAWRGEEPRALFARAPFVPASYSRPAGSGTSPAGPGTSPGTSFVNPASDASPDVFMPGAGATAADDVSSGPFTLASPGGATNASPVGPLIPAAAGAPEPAATATPTPTATSTPTPTATSTPTPTMSPTPTPVATTTPLPIPTTTPQPIAAAVPEPSTWLMMIAGFLTVGAALRRGRYSSSSRRSLSVTDPI